MQTNHRKKGENAMSDLNEFLRSRSIAQKIQLESLIVLNRMSLSPGDIVSLGETGTYSLRKEPRGDGELQIGEAVVATGKIVEESGEYYFEVSETVQNLAGKTEENK